MTLCTSAYTLTRDSQELRHLPGVGFQIAFNEHIGCPYWRCLLWEMEET